MKRYITVICGLACALSLSAQDFNSQVEVTKAYIPTVHGATKITAVPRMDDTVRLHPDIEYSVKPVACYTTFASSRISPASMSANPYVASNPCYISAAFGYPFRTELDVYVNNRNNSERKLGGYINHRGTYSRRRADIDSLLNATALYNAAGFFGSRHWDRFHVGGDINYDNRYLHRYGAFTNREFWGGASGVDTTALLPTAKQAEIDYGKVWGSVSVGNDFLNLDLFNYGVRLGTSFSHDMHGSEMATLSGQVRFAQRFGGKHGFDVAVDYDGYWGMSRLDSCGSQSFVVRPRYTFKSRVVNFGVGVDYGYRNSRGFDLSHSRVFPYLDLTVNAIKGYIVPFITAGGGFVDGSFEALSRANPYIAVATVAPTGSHTDVAAGISGSALQCLSYRAWFGFTYWDDMYWFTSLYQPVGSKFSDSFGVVIDDAEQYTVGAELEYMYAGALTLKVGGHYYGYVLHNFTGGGGNPSYDASLGISYKYRDKFIVSADAKLIGARNFFEIASAASPVMWASEVKTSMIQNHVPACVDVNFNFSYHLTDDWWMYLSLGNMANSKLYVYNHYRSLGTNVMLGFKTSF